jgi:hypothetical protein
MRVIEIVRLPNPGAGASRQTVAAGASATPSAESLR